jgi:parallel beta-helix repeat protein
MTKTRDLADLGGGFIQEGTGAVQRTVESKLQDVVSVKDFGAVGDGVTNDRAAIQAALNASRFVYFPTPTASYYISDSISVQSNTTVFGDGQSSHIQVPDGTVTCFDLNNVSGVVIRDLKISTKTQTNATAYKAAVLMSNECRNCLIENIGVFNWGYWGVSIFSSSNCIVRGCRFASWFGTVQDSAGIAIFKTSNNNLIEGNYCQATSDHGIFMQDPYTNDTPTGNSIINNYISNAKGDGISVYVTTAYDTQTLISGNRIFDIAGTTISGQSGHGIYVQSAGGTIVSDNTITNCCISTASFETQVVAAIGVSTGDISIYPTGTINEIIVSDNHITAQRGPGISVQTCDVPVLVQGNHILSTGTAAVRGEAIYCVNADGIQIKDNTIKHANTNYSAINIGASNKNLKGISVVGNRIRGATNGISFNPSGTGTFTDCVITNNIVSGLSSTGLFLNKVSNSQVSNNNIASTGIVSFLTTSTGVRMTANRFYSSTGGSSILFTGVNTGSVADESNDFQGTIYNEPGNGTILSRYANTAPGASGDHAAGDRVIQSVPVVGQPKGWRCTVSGNPGTWVSEGNL